MLDPEQAKQLHDFDFVIRSGAGETVVDPAHFFTRQ
jgi:hypothetical protein